MEHTRHVLDLRRPRKQRHTAKRIFERLRDEYGFDGGYTTVKDYRENRRQTKEMFVPLSHAPGHAQCDFGEALVVIGGVERKAHCFVIDSPQRRLLREGLPGGDHRGLPGRARFRLRHLGGVPQSILYDNTKLAVAKILGDGRRQRTRPSPSCSPTTCSRTGSALKGKVEGLVGYVRRNFLVPVPPSRASMRRLPGAASPNGPKLRGHMETIGQRMERDLDALLPLPPAAYDACERQAGRVSSLSLVRYRTNDYSVPVAYGYRDVLVRGTLMRWSSAAGPRSSPPTPTSGTTFVYDPPLPAALGEGAPWTRPRRCRAGLYEEFGTLRRLLESRMGRRGKREYVQLRLLEAFSQQEVHTAVKDAAGWEPSASTP